MTEIDMARQHGHNMEVEFVNNKDAFNIGYKSFLVGYNKAKNEAKEIIKKFLDANSELDMLNAQREAEQFIK